MITRLCRAAAVFDVYVQLQTDPVTMPTEDPTIKWDEAVSPHRLVAPLEIPQQDFDTEHKRTMADGLAYTTWHCLPEHRPLGGINRARRAVYQALSHRRRALGGQPQVEPDDDWLDRWECGPGGTGR